MLAPYLAQNPLRCISARENGIRSRPRFKLGITGGPAASRCGATALIPDHASRAAPTPAMRNSCSYRRRCLASIPSSSSLRTRMRRSCCRKRPHCRRTSIRCRSTSPSPTNARVLHGSCCKAPARCPATCCRCDRSKVTRAKLAATGSLPAGKAARGRFAASACIWWPAIRRSACACRSIRCRVLPEDVVFGRTGPVRQAQRPYRLMSGGDGGGKSRAVAPRDLIKTASRAGAQRPPVRLHAPLKLLAIAFALLRGSRGNPSAVAARRYRVYPPPRDPRAKVLRDAGSSSGQRASGIALERVVAITQTLYERGNAARRQKFMSTDATPAPAGGNHVTSAAQRPMPRSAADCRAVSRPAGRRTWLVVSVLGDVHGHEPGARVDEARRPRYELGSRSSNSSRRRGRRREPAVVDRLLRLSPI